MIKYTIQSSEIRMNPKHLNIKSRKISIIMEATKLLEFIHVCSLIFFMLTSLPNIQIRKITTDTNLSKRYCFNYNKGERHISFFFGFSCVRTVSLDHRYVL